MINFISELKRRNVFRVAGGYAVVAWLLAQMAAVLESSMNMPSWFDTVVVSFLLLGFPIAIILAWAFESTPEGIKRTEAFSSTENTPQTTNRRLDYILIIGLAIVAILIIGDRLIPNSTVPPIDIKTEAMGTLQGQSIAVLPFEDFSPNQDQTYFADGIAEELLNVLARAEGLRVASRTSAFSFKERDISIVEIGKALGVAHILEGSVRKAGNTLRITAQLIDAKTDVHMWSETYDRPLTAENIFDIQDEISKAIVLELNGRLDLLPQTSERVTQSTEALDAYLKGKQAYATRDIDDIETALTELIRATTLDPTFAVAHAKLARVYQLATEYGDLSANRAYARAEIHIKQALLLAPEDWDVLDEHAWNLVSKWKIFGSDAISQEDIMAAFDAAITANPNNAQAYRGKGWFLTMINRLDEAKISLQRAKVLDPRDPLIYVNLSGIASAQGNLDVMGKLIVEAVKLDPSSSYFRANLGYAYFNQGDLVTTHRVGQSCREESACAILLGAIYSQLGIEQTDSSLMGNFANYIKHYIKGDFEQVSELVKSSSDLRLTGKFDSYVSIARWDEAYQLIQDNPLIFASLLKGTQATDLGTMTTEVALLATLERKGDARVDAFRLLLEKKYENIEAIETEDAERYATLAAWRMLNNDPDGAMKWLNALAQRSITKLVSFDALFEPLKSRPDYQTFRKSMDGYRARDRAIIEAQLTNPPAVWWSVDELDDGDEL